MRKEIALIIGGRISQKEKFNLDEISVYEEVKMKDAVKLAIELEDQGEIKVIISTVGTASIIGNYVKTPIITANNTYFDILQTVKFFEEATGVVDENIALILHEAGTILPNKIQSFVRNNLSVFYYHNEEHISRIVSDLGKKNYKWFIGGPTTHNYVRALGLKCHLLYLGTETLQNAIDKARAMLEFARKEREQRQSLQTVLNLFPDGILATDQEGIITVSNPRAMEILDLTEREILGKKIDDITHDPSWKNVYQKGEKQVDEFREHKHAKIFTTRQPITDNGTIIGAVGTFQEAAKIEQLEHKYRKLQTLGLAAKYRFSNILGESSIMKKTIEKARAYAKVNATVLIEGETGTGKELFAQSIHNYSDRKNGPFVAINCAALPENLLESELMGYEEGAFTGAKKGGKPGLFELAHKGTVFLDEINQIPLQLQARILRIIQEKQVMRLGGERVIPVDVRIIAATNEDLEQLVGEKRFRDDLYYRLNVMNLVLPPLRERSEDIPLLVIHLFKLFSEIYGPATSFTDTSINMLINYSWPGNVRELENLIERYIVINRQQFVSELSFVKEYVFRKQDSRLFTSKEEKDCISVKINTLEKMEQQLIQQVLSKVKGNKIQASMILGLSRTTLWKRLKEKENNL